MTSERQTERDLPAIRGHLLDSLTKLKQLGSVVKKAQEFPLQMKIMLERGELKEPNARFFHHQLQLLIAFIDIYLNYLEEMKRYTQRLELIDTEVEKWEKVRKKAQTTTSSQFYTLKMLVEEGLPSTSHFLFKVRENIQRLLLAKEQEFTQLAEN